MRLIPVAALFLASVVLAPAAQAQAGAAHYRALGTEPFWSLTIDNTVMRYDPADGRKLRVAKPRPIVGFNGERYVTRAMTVHITHVECSDGMSDRTFHDTVRVTIGRQTLRGCGGAELSRPAASLLEGEWTVASLNGRPVLANSNPTIRFEGARVSGTTGCNSFRGDFRFERGRLSAGPLATTRMACPGASGRQERAILDALRTPLSVTRNPAGKLVMTAPGGARLVLVRAQR